MKKKLNNAIMAIVLLLMPAFMFGQTAPNLGSASDFVLFTTTGGMSNTGISQLTGNVGTNNGAVTGFGNVNGVMTFTGDALSAPCAADLLIAYGELNSQVPGFFPANLLGGNTLNTGVYSITGATTLSGTLTLDAQGNPGAVFVFQIQGPFSTAADSKIKLINGAQACNVFWKIEGEVNMASGTSMKGTIIANNAAIHMNTGDTLEGRALSIAGAVTLDGVMAYTPVGCGSPVLHGPIAPTLLSALCYTVFSASGPVTNAGVSNIIGDVGTNVGLTTGFNPLDVTGTIHPIPDGSTNAAAIDLLSAYTYVNALPHNIELLYPAQFGNNLVLTPHTYVMNGAVTFTDTVYLNAMGDPNAVFVIKTYGAFATSTYSKVLLTNGTKPENVYWMVNGAVTINDYSIFNGTIICNSGAMNLNTGATINGRALTTTGIVQTVAITATMPPGCSILSAPNIVTQPINEIVCAGDSAMFIVSATGADLTYQWRKGAVNLVNNSRISGATSDTLVIYPVLISDTAYNYNVVVSGSLLPAEISANASLNVNIAPVITTEPTSQSACAGNTVHFSVVATGTSLTYQWRKGIVDLANGGNISGANSASLNIYPATATDAAADYNVIVSGTCAPSDTSISVSLTIDVAPVVVTAPVNKTVCVGDSVFFSIVVTGSNLSYQWRKGNVNIVNGGNISGANSDTLRINPVLISDTASNYNVVVTGGCSAISGTVVDLNMADEFGILAGIDITSTGFSVINGMNVGLSPGVRSSITGFPPATVVNGAIYASDDIAPPGVAAMLTQAKLDLTNAYLFAEGATAPAPATVAGDQGGLTLAPGIYKSTSTLLIQSGDLTLDGQGDPNATWIFQIASDFTTIGGAGGNVILAGGAQAKNITWQVGSSATIGNGTSFKGNILALTSITMNTGSSIEGKLLARNGSVVLSGTNIINSPVDTLTNSTNDTSIYVSLIANPLPIANAGVDKVINLGSNVMIGTLPIVGNTYSWTPITALSSAIIAQPIANPTDTTTYALKVTSTFGCIAYDTVIVFVIMPNSPPVAINDTIFTCENSGTSIVNVQINDTDPNGDPMTTTIYETPTNGLAVVNGNNINYTPNTGFNGLDTLTYIVCDNGTPSLCDTAFLFIQVTPTSLTNVSTSICNGDSIFIAGAFRTQAGTYSDTLNSILGCDSIIRTVLTLNPVYAINISTSICNGDSIFLAGAFRTQAGTYSDTLNTILGCDSIIRTVLTLNPVYAINTSATICDGDSIFLAGAYRNSVGIYTDTLTSVYGCDSIVITALNITLLPVASFTSSMIDFTSYSFVNTSTNAASYLWNFGDGVTSIVANPIHIYEGAGSYLAMLIATNSCTSDTAIQILDVVCGTEFFNGFSPNGDGLNDYWNIPMLNCYPDNNVLIINRWGSEVWSGDNYNNNSVRWTGQNMNNNDLPDGTYYYIITYGGIEKRGWVFIKR